MPTILAVSPIAQTHARLQPVPTQRQVPQPRPCALSSCIPRTRTSPTPARPRVSVRLQLALPPLERAKTPRTAPARAPHGLRISMIKGAEAGAGEWKARAWERGGASWSGRGGDRARERARAGVWTGERGSCSWAHRTSRRVLFYIIRASHITSRRQHGGRPRRVQESARR